MYWELIILFMIVGFIIVGSILGFKHLKCNHNWELIKEVYSLPKTFNGNEVSGKEGLFVYSKIVLGYTTLVFQCKKCKKLRLEECLGVSNNKISKNKNG